MASLRVLAWDVWVFCFRRIARTFKFPELKGKRGAWIIEFIGGGKSSRALIRKGQWSVIQRIGPAGDMLTVLDEAHQPVRDAVAWIDGRKLAVDEKSGAIIVPFAQQPSESAVLTDAAGEFATLVQIQRHAEAYKLDAHFHIAREQLLAGKDAVLAVRTALLLGDAQMPLGLLENPKLTIVSTTLDGVRTTSEAKIASLDSAKDFTYPFAVPDRLKLLEVTLTAEIGKSGGGEEKESLSARNSWGINEIDEEEVTDDAHLSRIGDGYIFELLGKNGEPEANQPIEFDFEHRDFLNRVKASLRTDDKGRVDLGELRGIKSVDTPHRHRQWTLSGAERTWPSVIDARAGEPLTIPWTGEAPPEHVSLLETRGGTFVTDFRAAVVGFPKDAWTPRRALNSVAHPPAPQLSSLIITGLQPGDYSLALNAGLPSIQIRVTDGKPVGNWLISPNRELEIRDAAPLNIQSVTRDGDAFVVIQLANAGQYTRVHVAASRFLPGVSVFDALGSFSRFAPAIGSPARLPNLFAAGRQIGDEYRYILERRYSKAFPGNMLSRPGLLLDPWEVRSTNLQGQQMAEMQRAGSTAGGRDAAIPGLQPIPQLRAAQDASSPRFKSDLNFLANPAPVLYNLKPDEHGAIRIAAREFGDRQYVQIYAEDLTGAVTRALSLPEAPTQFKDVRLAAHLDPQKAFTEKKEQTILAAGETLKLADVLTSDLETYDSLASVHALFTTLSGNPNLAKFAWVIEWPKLKPEAQRAKYSEFACHELNLFLKRKDPAFFAKVILPYLRNKKDKTFIDEYLLGNDLHGYLAPWSYERLNVAERCLLAQSIPAEAIATTRHLRELWDLLPPNPDREDHLFETALRGRSLQSTAGEGDKVSTSSKTVLGRAKNDYGEKINRAKSERAADFDTGVGGIAGSKQPEMPKGIATPATVAAMAAGGATENGRSTLSLDDASAVTGKSAAKAGRLSAGEGFSPQVAEELEKQFRKSIDSGNIANYRIFSESLATSEEAVRQRALVRQFFRALGPTKEWAENNYYQLPIASQNAELISINAFWRDYAAWDGKSPFVSAHLAEASRNFSEMMLALTVLDLPFESPKHATHSEGAQFTLTAAGPLVAFHKEIELAGPPKENAELLVSENFYRHGDRYRMEGNEKFDKYVTGEFLSGVVYGANVVVTNSSSTPQKLELLLQIPQGALPVKGSKATDSKRLQLAPYTTQTFEYFFYFPTPRPEPFAHYPAHLSRGEQAAGAANATTFKVVRQLSEMDTKSWDYISQFGSEDDVFAFLDRENIARLDLTRIAWRARKDAAFFHKLIAVLARRHIYNDVLYSYAVVHNDAPALGEWLRHRGDFIGQCGPWLASKLVSIDPIERHAYQHLEYSPLVNQRAHPLGSDHRIPNPALRAQYLSFLNILAFKPALDATDQMSLTYYLFLQDRTEEALTRFHAIQPAALPTRLQYDYFQCYSAFYEERLADARGIANQYADYPVDRWRKLFSEVSTQLDEIEGKQPLTTNGASPIVIRHSDFVIPPSSNRETDQSQLAATEPSFDFKIENRQIAFTWKNLTEVTVHYYLMDPEFQFSANPFITQDSHHVSIIKPTKTSVEKLPEGKDSLMIPLPGEFEKANVLVEILGAGQQKTQTSHANTLKLAIAENYGRLELRDQIAGKPVSKAYVKVYARLRGGAIRFFKDGYTDLRGKFDYASLNSSDTPSSPQYFPASPGAADTSNHQMLQPQELNSVEKLSILILSDTHGALVREVNPPAE